MRVFITGGTGFIGSAVVQELLGAGHAVTALNRSPERAENLRRLGVEPLAGELEQPEPYAEAAAEHDAVVHCAFDYAEGGVATDAAAIEALTTAAREAGEAPADGPRIFLYTSGCWVLGDTGGEPAAEDAPTEEPAEVVAWRPAHERQVLDAADADAGALVTAVVRPGMVYGGSGSLTARLFTSAEEEGASLYVGSGENHWSMVHRRGLARLYRLVVEARASGIFHGVDGHPVRVADAARAASDAAGAGGAIRELPLAEAREGLGAVADALTLDQRLVTRRSAELGWEPEIRSFLDGAEVAYRELVASRR